MAYHEGLWVTITAAAPVLALTYVTSAGRAAKMDDDAISLGIWNDDVKVGRLFAGSMLGILVCAVDFVWGLLALAKLNDFGPLILPLSIMVLAFLMLFLVFVLELRSRFLLNKQRTLGAVFEKHPYLPDSLRESIRIAENNNQVYWTIKEAPQVIRAISAAGHVVQRIYMRDANASFDKPITIPEPIDTSKPIDAISQGAIDAVNNVSSPDAVIRIIWT